MLQNNSWKTQQNWRTQSLKKLILTKISTLKYVSLQEKFSRFQEQLFLNNSPSYFIDGVIDVENLPEFAQFKTGSLFLFL
jgi:hypothetical protein